MLLIGRASSSAVVNSRTGRYFVLQQLIASIVKPNPQRIHQCRSSSGQLPSTVPSQVEVKLLVALICLFSEQTGIEWTLSSVLRALLHVLRASSRNQPRLSYHLVRELNPSGNIYTPDTRGGVEWME